MLFMLIVRGSRTSEAGRPPAPGLKEANAGSHRVRRRRDRAAAGDWRSRNLLQRSPVAIREETV